MPMSWPCDGTGDWTLKAGHPSIGTPCPVCHGDLEAGDRTTLAMVGAASDEDADLAAAGRPHTVTGQLVHWRCATG